MPKNLFRMSLCCGFAAFGFASSFLSAAEADPGYGKPTAIKLSRAYEDNASNCQDPFSSSCGQISADWWNLWTSQPDHIDRVVAVKSIRLGNGSPLVREDQLLPLVSASQGKWLCANVEKSRRAGGLVVQMLAANVMGMPIAVSDPTDCLCAKSAKAFDLGGKTGVSPMPKPNPGIQPRPKLTY